MIRRMILVLLCALLAAPEAAARVALRSNSAGSKAIGQQSDRALQKNATSTSQPAAAISTNVGDAAPCSISTCRAPAVVVLIVVAAVLVPMFVFFTCFRSAPSTDFNHDKALEFVGVDKKRRATLRTEASMRGLDAELGA